MKFKLILFLSILHIDRADLCIGAFDAKTVFFILRIDWTNLCIGAFDAKTVFFYSPY